MRKLIPGFTGLIPKGADYYETLKKYAGYGYKLTEGAFACFREGDPKENAKRIRDMGLELWTLSTSVQSSRPMSRSSERWYSGSRTVRIPT